MIPPEGIELHTPSGYVKTACARRFARRRLPLVWHDGRACLLRKPLLN